MCHILVVGKYIILEPNLLSSGYTTESMQSSTIHVADAFPNSFQVLLPKCDFTVTATDRK